MLTARLAQLRAQGHGPQRHSDPDEDALKRRAVYGLDPETGSQDEGGDPHNPGPCASKFTTPEDYVKAEAAMRAELKALVCPGGVAVAAPVTPQRFDRPTSTVFPAVANHCEGFLPPGAPLPKVVSSIGLVTQVPSTVVGAPVFPPEPADVPPAPPPPLSNANIKRYKDVALAAAQRGLNVAGQMTALQGSLNAPPPPGAETKVANLIGAMGPVTAPPPVVPADQDRAAMKVFADANSHAAVFGAGSNIFTMFVPVNPNVPCGEWKAF